MHLEGGGGKKNEASRCSLPIIPVTHNPATVQLQGPWLVQPASAGLDWVGSRAQTQRFSQSPNQAVKQAGWRPLQCRILSSSQSISLFHPYLCLWWLQWCQLNEQLTRHPSVMRECVVQFLCVCAENKKQRTCRTETSQPFSNVKSIGDNEIEPALLGGIRGKENTVCSRHLVVERKAGR